MKVTIETIDLEKAIKYLAKNIDFSFEKVRSGVRTNRPVTISRVNFLASEMLRGNWRETNQGIAFDSNGNLIDGQKRLKALVQAATEGVFYAGVEYPANPNVTITVQVTRELDPSVFEVIDTGEARSSNQILSMNGITNGMVLASAARLLYAFDNIDEIERWESTRLSNHDVLSIVQSLDLQRELTVSSGMRKIGLIPSACIVGTHVCRRTLVSDNDGKTVDDFNEVVRAGNENGESLTFDDPRWAFREYLIRSIHAPGRKRDTTTQLMIYIKCWNDHVNGRRRSLCSWRSNEGIIRPKGY